MTKKLKPWHLLAVWVLQFVVWNWEYVICDVVTNFI